MVVIMSREHPESVGTPALVAEMREVIKETRRTIEASQVILDRCAVPAPEAPAEHAADLDLLGGIADGLIVAYEYAKLDKDTLTLGLLEKAMLHVGRRLARTVGPKEAGLARH